MRQLARTLLILGSVTACERAHPECEPASRVQLAQPTEPPQPAAIAVPLVDTNGAPAVGNIGQTGAPKTVQRPSRRVQRVVRAATAPALIRPELPPRVPPRNPTRLEFQIENQPAFSLARERPRVDRRERPAVGNMGRRARMEPREELAVEEQE